jgi:hypothetical protein
MLLAETGNSKDVPPSRGSIFELSAFIKTIVLYEVGLEAMLCNFKLQASVLLIPGERRIKGTG